MLANIIETPIVILIWLPERRDLIEWDITFGHHNVTKWQKEARWGWQYPHMR